MIPLVVALVLLCAAVLGLSVLALRRRFERHLVALTATLRRQDARLEPRSDLPPEVVALAARLGVVAGHAPSFTTLEQSGQMWRTPGAKPMPFTASQTIRVAAPGFLWRATMGPMTVADYFVDGTGGLEVRLFGAFRIARMVGTASVNRGEVLRYLAELPWCPDAILVNRSLDWTVVDAKTIEVATGEGAERGELTFVLDDEGLIVTASAASRPYAEANGQTTERPWRGRFWDYHHLRGRYVPMQGEVEWGLPEGDFVYWRGRLHADS